MTSAKTRQKPKKQPETPDPIMSLLRMCAEALSSPAIPCEPVWKTQKTKSGRTEYQLLNLGRPISNKNCSAETPEELWPTVRASEWKGCGPHGSKSREYGLKKGHLAATVAEAEHSARQDGAIKELSA